MKSLSQFFLMLALPSLLFAAEKPVVIDGVSFSCLGSARRHTLDYFGPDAAKVASLLKRRPRQACRLKSDWLKESFVWCDGNLCLQAVEIFQDAECIRYKLVKTDVDPSLPANFCLSGAE